MMSSEGEAEKADLDEDRIVASPSSDSGTIVEDSPASPGVVRVPRQCVRIATIDFHPEDDPLHLIEFESHHEKNKTSTSQFAGEFKVLSGDKPGFNQPIKNNVTDATPQHVKSIIEVLCVDQRIVKYEDCKKLRAAPKQGSEISHEEEQSQKSSNDNSNSNNSNSSHDDGFDIHETASDFDPGKLNDHAFEAEEKLKDLPQEENDDEEPLVQKQTKMGVRELDAFINKRLEEYRLKQNDAFVQLHGEITSINSKLLNRQLSCASLLRSNFYVQEDPKPQRDSSKINLLIQVDKIKFDILDQFSSEFGGFEPLFCSLVVLDVGLKERVTETFYFENNTKELIKHFFPRNHPTHKAKYEEDGEYARLDVEDLNRRALFSFNKNKLSPNLYLVLSVSRIVQNFKSKSAEVYQEATGIFKKSKHKPEKLKQIQSKIIAQAETTGDLRKPFFWCACNLAPEKLEATNKTQTFNLTDLIIWKDGKHSDDYLYSHISADTVGPAAEINPDDNDNPSHEDSMVSPKGKKKQGSATWNKIPGSVQLQITPINVYPPERQYASSKEDMMVIQMPNNETIIAREMRELNEKKGNLALPEVNRMYIYPEKLELALGMFDSSRHITVSCCYKTNDDNLSDTGLKCFFKETSTPILTDQVFTHATTKRKFFLFSSEFRATLPHSISAKDHLLFTFWEVASKKGKEGAMVPLGYGVLKLYQNGNVLKSGNNVVKVYQPDAMPKNNYLNEDINAKKKDGRLNLRIQIKSPFYTQDYNLNKFFEEIDARGSNGTEAKVGSVIDAIASLRFLYQPTFFSYSSILIHQLLKIIINDPHDGVKATAFQTLLFTLDNIAASTLQSNLEEGTAHVDFSASYVDLLLSYIQKDFSFSNTHAPLLQQWIDYLENVVLLSGRQHSRSAYSRQSNTSNASDDSTTLPQNQQQQRFIYPSNNKFQKREMEEQSKRLMYLYSSVLFSLIAKSMVLSLHENDNLSKVNKVKRTDFFPEDFNMLLRSFVDLAARAVIKAEADERSDQALNLSNSLSYFFQHLFSIMDRGVVLGLVRHYINTVIPIENPDACAKLSERCYQIASEFMTCLMRYENFIPLSHPASPVTKTISELRDSLCNSYFINSIFSEHIVFMLCHTSKEVRSYAENYLHEALLRSSRDIRYKGKFAQSKIAASHFGTVLNWLDFFDKWRAVSSSGLRFAQAQIDITKKNVEDTQNKIYTLEELAKKNEIFAQQQLIKDKKVLSSVEDEGTKARIAQLEQELKQHKENYRISKLQMKQEKQQMLKARRNLLVCFLHIVNNIERKVLSEWWTKEATSVKLTFCSALQLSIESFRCDPILLKGLGLPELGSPMSPLGSPDEGSITSPTSASVTTPPKHQRSRGATFSLRNPGTPPPATLGPTSPSSPINLPSTDLNRFTVRFGQPAAVVDEKTIKMEKNLSAEVGFFALSLLVSFMRDNEAEMRTIETVSQEGEPVKQQAYLFDSAFNVLNEFLSNEQPENVLLMVFLTIHKVMRDYVDLIFSKQLGNYSERLCMAILRHCNFTMPSLRKNASFLLFSFINSGYDKHKGFPRLKVTLTLSLSELISKIKDERFMKQSIREIAMYAEKTTPPEGVKKDMFIADIKDICGRLDTLLKDILQVNQYTKEGVDSETMADLYQRICDAYSYSPDLKVAWLQTLADHQAKYNHFPEAGQCIVRIAALIIEYLNIVDPSVLHDISTHLIKNICPSYTKEIPDEIRTMLIGEGALSQSSRFSKEGLISTLEKAIDLMKMGECWEYSVELYQLLIPFLKREYNYKKLGEAYNNLASLCSSIADGNYRVFASYYRVAFYGKLLGPALHRKEFIYKMPKVTRLIEIQRYLQDHFGRKHGMSKVKIITNSKPVDESTIDLENMIHIQITFVKPYEETPTDRPGHFEKNNNFDQFMFEAPHMPDGRPMTEEVQDQYKKKTILSIQKPFPNTRIRLEVIKKQEILLTPIETAIEAVQDKVTQLSTEIAKKPVDLHMLHLALTGTIRLQVHAGPKEFARVFLGGSDEKYNQHHVDLLREKLEHMVALCGKAVTISGRHVSSKQKPFQDDLELGFKETCEFFSKYINVGKYAAPSAIIGTSGVTDNNNNSSNNSNSSNGTTTTTMQLKSAGSAKQLLHQQLTSVVPRK